MIGAIVSGLFFGFGNGVSPGPLMALSISATIKSGKTQGILVSISPLISDIFILSVAFYLSSYTTNYADVLKIISILGSVFLIFLGYKCFSYKTVITESVADLEKFGMLKGALTNILNPYPYAFWITVGAPFVISLYKTSGTTVTILYFVSFYFSMFATKVAIVYLTDAGKVLLSNRGYEYVMKALGVLFWGFAIWYLIYSLNSVGF